MRTNTERGTFADVILGSTPQIAAIARKLRDIIADVLPDAVEVPLIEAAVKERKKAHGLE